MPRPRDTLGGMKYMRVPADAVGPDPIASPGTVPEASIINAPRYPSGTDIAPYGILVASSSPTATPAIDIWVEMELTDKPNEIPAASRIWRKLGTVTLAAGEVKAATIGAVVPGRVYFQVKSGQSAGQELYVTFT